ncbi:hypothetical protein [Aeromicrobium fastidiosum]|uniref:Uncharacterized protein n=1 Tax=Aeromicrobium fastidiosum TaxID=52699 RepID=A0A641AN56_9ACTN|nr:hypothetical protein [Aeromicrobium fastidiosum]KAA1378296.1 hypothetical protein ESP62_007935 [Aeromicrobium fastidiosum]MBP2388884.1 hypothetical protein [Aeromicrobium fastidiosum]
MTGTQRVVAAPGAYRLVLPSGWFTISADPSRRDKDITRLMDRQFTGTARDELIGLRVELDRRLRRDVARAAERGTTQIHALVDPLLGLPISATLVVAQLFAGPAGALDLQVLELLGDAEGVLENDAVRIAGVDALRRVRRAEAPLTEDEGAPLVWHTHVDYVVQADADRLLVLSFVTSTDEVAEAMVVVFDKIAATLHLDGDGDLTWSAPSLTEQP